jgi:surfeit locus 1 family protein
MKWRSMLGAFVLIGAALVCVRLGFWQLSRLAQKRAYNQALRDAMAAPPIELGAERMTLDAVRHRRVIASGTYDESCQILLAGRSNAGGSPGVHVVTPLKLATGGAVLVDRGWLFAGDASTARPQDFSEPGARTVTGIADSVPPGSSGAPWRRIESDTVTLWSTHLLALDSARVRVSYALAPFLIRELPSPDLPAQPVRAAPRPLDETMHISYAAQWFLFAVILLIGPPIVLAARRRARGRPSDLVIPER